MKVERTNKSLPHRVDSSPKWYKILAEFANSRETTMELIPAPGEYKSLKVAQSVACTAIHRYGFNMSTVKEANKLYIIKDKI